MSAAGKSEGSTASTGNTSYYLKYEILMFCARFSLGLAFFSFFYRNHYG